MRQSSRLIVNVLSTMLRMVLTFGIGLTITRLLLNGYGNYAGLGKDDYGLLTALGASGALLTMLTTALTTSTMRHMAYEIGRCDAQRLHQVFSSAMLLYVALSATCLLVGAALAWPILQVLTIPPGRETAAAWVLAMNILTIAMTLLTTPYRAVFEAHQEILIAASFDLTDRALALCAVLTTLWLPYDTLVTYVAISLAVTLTVQLAMAGLAMWRYPIARPGRERRRWAQVRELLDFAGWSLLGVLPQRMRVQGVLVVLNILFGTAINAGFSIALQLMSYHQQVASSVLQAIQPAMTGMAGKSRRDKVQDLMIHSCVLPIVLTTPLLAVSILDTESVLTLWLGDYPAVTPLFAKLLLIAFWIASMGNGSWQAMQALGMVRYSAILASVPATCVMAVVLAAALIWPLPMWVLPATHLAITAGVGFVLIPWLILPRLEMSLGVWLRRIVMPAAIISGAQVLATLGLMEIMATGMTRLLASLSVNTLLAGFLGWTVTLNATEREHIKRFARAGYAGLRRRLPADVHDNPGNGSSSSTFGPMGGS